MLFVVIDVKSLKPLPVVFDNNNSNTNLSFMVFLVKIILDQKNLDQPKIQVIVKFKSHIKIYKLKNKLINFIF